jgi:hypothetical protein
VDRSQYTQSSQPHNLRIPGRSRSPPMHMQGIMNSSHSHKALWLSYPPQDTYTSHRLPHLVYHKHTPRPSHRRRRLSRMLRMLDSYRPSSTLGSRHTQSQLVVRLVDRCRTYSQQSMSYILKDARISSTGFPEGTALPGRHTFHQSALPLVDMCHGICCPSFPTPANTSGRCRRYHSQGRTGRN